MRELNDDDLQKMIENGLPEQSDGNDDLKIYSRLFEELNREPEVKLSYSFSANVIRKIRYQEQRKSDFRLGILVGVITIIGLLVFGNSIYFREALPAISGSKWVILAGLLILAIIQFLDQKLVIERRLRK